MFYVLNKSKIYSYIIAVCTVVVLFVAATKFNEVMIGNETVETGTNTMFINKIEGNTIN